MINKPQILVARIGSEIIKLVQKDIEFIELIGKPITPTEMFHKSKEYKIWCMGHRSFVYTGYETQNIDIEDLIDEEKIGKITDSLMNYIKKKTNKVSSEYKLRFSYENSIVSMGILHMNITDPLTNFIITMEGWLEGFSFIIEPSILLYVEVI